MISQRIGITKSTLSDWLTAIPYKPNKETIARIGRARAQSGKVKAILKQQSFDDAKKTATTDIGPLISKRDVMMLGLGIYIGEGSKSHDIVRLTNANPLIIRATMRWFKDFFGLHDRNFALRIHVYPDTDIKQALQFWSKNTGLSLTQFHKTHVDIRTNKKMAKRGKLPFGTAHLHVRSLGKKEFGAFLSRRINAMIDFVLQ
jgi:hypothetical protein